MREPYFEAGKGKGGFRRVGHALLLWLSGCSLLSDPFDPPEVGRVIAESTPEEPSPPPASAIREDEAAPPSRQTADSTGEGLENDTAKPRLSPVSDAAQSSSSASAVPGDDAGLTAPDEPFGIDGGAPAPPEAASSAQVACPGRSLGASCYDLVAEALAWADAEARCTGWGGHLVRVDSADEDAFLSEWLREPSPDGGNAGAAWIGGTDADSDGTFVWSDAAPLGYVGWAADQPNNGAGVDCIAKSNDQASLWSDQRCIDQHRFLCERPL